MVVAPAAVPQQPIELVSAWSERKKTGKAGF
jgi:hypothetical protein